MAHFEAFCATVTSGTLRAVDRFADIASLYGGKGGQMLEGEELRPISGPPPSPTGPSSIQGDQGDNPPSYVEANLGPSALVAAQSVYYNHSPSVP